ncbi:MAG: transcriptional regulator, partial [Halobacteriaceae archaeon]
EFTILVETLHEQGFSERTEIERAYEELDPSIILAKDGFPNWDIFIEEVAGKLHLTDSMKDRVDEIHSFDNFEIHLLSLTDIFLFKSVTGREGDLEDATLIARQGKVDWEALFTEIQRQEDQTDQYFSFDLLDTLDIIEEREDIQAPIQQRLASYCLEKGLLITLEEPKTIRDLREELNFPDHQIYNKLRKLEEENKIDVDRSGKLNTYQVL